MEQAIKKDDVVTVQFENVVSSNTYIVDTVEKDSALLKHPLYDTCLLRYPLDTLNTVAPNVKDSTERSLDFARSNRKFLDYNTNADLDALCLYFVIKRKLTPRQKTILSNICGTIVSIKFNNDVKEAMNLITKNAGVLDDFNAMWYNNFSGLFSGKQPITSKKQRSAIFNMAGFVLAELETPTALK